LRPTYGTLMKLQERQPAGCDKARNCAHA
jgi:NAD(P)-dependent dehydrogenase (short-subunit alcohol dehydrogenase family)